MLPTDWGAPTTPVLSRIRDTRAIQFWDKDHLVAAELQQHLVGNQGNCCKRHGILWDVAVLYPKSVLWATQPPTFIGGAVLDVAPELGKQIAVLSTYPR